MGGLQVVGLSPAPNIPSPSLSVSCVASLVAPPFPNFTAPHKNEATRHLLCLFWVFVACGLLLVRGRSGIAWLLLIGSLSNTKSFCYLFFFYWFV